MIVLHNGLIVCSLYTCFLLALFFAEIKVRLIDCGSALYYKNLYSN